MVLVVAGVVIWRVSWQKVIPAWISPIETDSQTEGVLDLSSYPPGTNVNRWVLLNLIAGEHYKDSNTYLLDDNDSSTRVTIGTYNTEYHDGKRYHGGIIMLKRLPDGKDSIYWEITSPLLNFGGGPLSGIVGVKDINNDGLKEILAAFSEFTDSSQVLQTAYWIISVNPHTKTYKVLNVVTDRNKNIDKDFNFEHPDLSKGYTNNFEVFLPVNGTIPNDIIQDIDHDGVSEIVIDHFTSQETYKYNGTEYYLWKTVTKKAE